MIKQHIRNDNDIPFKTVIGTEDEEAVRTAYDAEHASLEANGFTEVLHDDDDYAHCLKIAKPGRVIYSLKRATSDGNRRKKCRAVEQGHLTKSPLGTNTYSPVTSHEELRATVLRPNRNAPHPDGPRLLAKVDVCTAYLQSNSFPPGTPKTFHKFWDPFRKRWIVRFERTHLYGSDLAAKSWYSTVREQLLAQGYQQGFAKDSPAANLNAEYLRKPAANCPCMFYKPGEDTVVLVYVDDMFVDGRKKHMDKFFADFQSRFKTTEVEWLTADEPLDFNGIIISMDDVCVYMDMQPYITKALQLFGMDGDDCAPLRIPMYGEIIKNPEAQVKLSIADQANFLTKVGVAHWIAQTVSPSTKFTVQRISQHMASPNQGALTAINDLLRYHKGHKWHGLATPLFDPNPPAGNQRYCMYTDSDNSSNPEIHNKRKAMYGFVFGYAHSQEAIDLVAAAGKRVPKVAPVTANSKSLGVAFATSHIGEHHVGTGSGENEIYGMANAIDEGLSFSYMMEEMGQDFPLPMVMKVDATTAEVFAMGTAQRSRLKNVDQRLKWVQVCRDKRVCTVDHVPGVLNVADIMTKYFFKHPSKFEKQRDWIQVKVPDNKFNI